MIDEQRVKELNELVEASMVEQIDGYRVELPTRRVTYLRKSDGWTRLLVTELVELMNERVDG